MKPCRFFNGSHGSCKYGDGCKFLHARESTSVSSALPRAPPQPPRERSYRDLVHSSNPLDILARHSGKPILFLEDMVQMIDSGLKSLDKDKDVPDALQIMGGNTLGQRPGISHFQPHMKRMIAKFVSDSAGDASKTFFTLILPLLQLVGHVKVRESAFSEFVNPLYSQVGLLLHSHGKLASFYQKLLLGEEPLPEGRSWIDVIEPAVVILNQLLSRFQGDEAFKAIQEHSDVLHAALTALIQIHLKDKSSISGLHRRRLQDAMTQSQALLCFGHIRADEILSAEEATRKRDEHKRRIEAQVAEILAERRRSYPSNQPGEMRPGGPRHDNDFADFRKIRVAPTSQELHCTEPPFLPQNNKWGSASHFLASAPHLAHVDVHFRLLRHDLVQPLAQAVRLLSDAKSLESLKIRDGRALLGNSRMSILRNVSIRGIALPTGAQDLQITASFTQPRQQSKHDALAWWKRTGAFGFGTLICFCLTGGVEAMSCVLGVVANRDLVHLSSDNPMLGIRLFDGQDFSALLKIQDQCMDEQLEIVLVQDGNSFFAYEPFLKALQKIQTLPLAQHLLLQMHEGSEAAVRKELSRAPSSLQLPAYLEGTPSVDLNCLADQKKMASLSPSKVAELRGILSQFPCSSKPSKKCMAALLEATTLDESQALALTSALFQEVVVIQGPPGTGKTYLAVQIMRVLLANANKTNGEGPAFGQRYNRRWMVEEEEEEEDFDLRREDDSDEEEDDFHLGSYFSPVLVICLTNHALDAYLLSILDAGITKEIIRIGGNSKCSRLEPYNLRNQSVKAGGRRVWELMKQLEALKVETVELNQKLVGFLLAPSLWPTIEELLVSLSQSGSHISEVRALAWLESFDMGIRPWNEDEKGEVVDEEGYIAMRSRVKRKDLIQEWIECNHGKESEDQRRTGPTPTTDRPLEQLIAQETNVWNMSRPERLRLLHFLRAPQFDHLGRRIDQLQAEISKAHKDLQREYNAVNLLALRNAAVVGMTTSGFAKNRSLISALGPRVVMVEEAAEVFEAHILASLSSSVEHLILIGDHEQLRPKCNVYELQQTSRRGLDLDVSLLERLAVGGRIPLSSLSTQRRMRPEISALIRETIYSHLIDHPDVFKYPPVRGMTRNLFFWKDDFPEEGGSSATASKSNPLQAARAVALMRYLIQQGYGPEDIVILVPYVGQLITVKRVLERFSMQVVMSDRDLAEVQEVDADALSMALDDDQDKEEVSIASEEGPSAKRASLADKRVVNVAQSIRVATVDNFQGEEAKVIILSLTRNNAMGDIGFLKMKNRINVMLSRAQHGMYILGNEASLMANTDRSPMWPKVLQMLQDGNQSGTVLEVKCENHGHVTRITSTDQFESLVGDGGCMRQCPEALPCGHACPRRCHVDDPDHFLAAKKCVKPCDRLHKPCSHPCYKLCHEDCGHCSTILPSVGPLALCGHIVEKVECWRVLEGKVLCKTPVSVTLPKCKHEAVVPCNRVSAAKEGKEPCLSLVSVTWPGCLHSQGVLCCNREKVLAGPCSHKCEKVLACSHLCSQSCHMGRACGSCDRPCWIACSHRQCKRKCSEPCIPCASDCSWKGCTHNPEPCLAPCGAPCDRLPCNMRCEERLACGHQCPGVYGEDCRSFASFCIDPACKAKATEAVLSQQVDLTMLTSFGDLESEQVEVDPLVALPCGHVFQASTLDRHLELHLYYESHGDVDEGLRQWISPNLLPAELGGCQANCPTCRAPMGRGSVEGRYGVLRYGRVIKKVELDIIDRKFMGALGADLTRLRGDLDQILKENPSGDVALRRSVQLLNDLRSLAAKDSPKRLCYEAALSRKVKMTEGSEASIELGSLSLLQPDPTMLAEIRMLSLHAMRARLTAASSVGAKWAEADYAASAMIKKSLDWIKELNSSRTWSKSLEMSRGVLELLLHSVGLLDKQSGVIKPDAVIKKQLSLTQQAREVCRSAIDISQAQNRTEDKACMEIRDIFNRLDGIEDQVRNNKARELIDVLTAMSSAMGYGANSVEALNYMSNHLYRCPNGHLYVIADCGMVMQQSFCAECGEPVGGGHHQLLGTNAPARDEIEKLKRLLPAAGP